MLDLVGNPNCWFCHAQAQFILLSGHTLVPVGFKANMLPHVRSLKSHPKDYRSPASNCHPGLMNKGLLTLVF